MKRSTPTLPLRIDVITVNHYADGNTWHRILSFSEGDSMRARADLTSIIGPI